MRVPLQEQPFKILALLLARPGELVRREELQRELWPGDTFVDFERGLNTAVKRLRDALGDDADTPRFIETLSRRGYRFIAPIARPSPTVAGEEQPRPATRFGASAALLAIIILIVLAAGLRMLVQRSAASFRAHPQIGSVAVLPLADSSAGADQSHLAHAMHEGLIASLAEIREIRVLSRTSVMQYADARPRFAELGRTLKVDGIVDGSVERVGDRLRVTVRVIEAAGERVLHAASAERSLHEAPALTRDVARAIAGGIGVVVRPGEDAQVRTARAVVPAAYEALAKGLSMRPSADAAKHRQRIAFFQEAVDRDPEYAEAYAALGAAWEGAAMFGYVRPSEAASRSKAAVLKALALDEIQPRAHVTLGTVLLRYEHDWTGAERAFKRALALTPNDTAALEAYWNFLAIVERYDEAIAVARRQLSVDPVNGDAALGWVFLRAGRMAEAALHYEKAIQLRPGSWLRANLATAYAKLGRSADAVSQCDEAMRGAFGAPPHAFCAQVYAAAGDRRRAARIVSDLLARTEREYVDPYFVAVALLTSDESRAVEWFDKAYEESTPGLLGMRHNPWLKESLDHPRLQNIVRRTNYPTSPVPSAGVERAATR